MFKVFAFLTCTWKYTWSSYNESTGYMSRLSGIYPIRQADRNVIKETWNRIGIWGEYINWAIGMMVWTPCNIIESSLCHPNVLEVGWIDSLRSHLQEIDWCELIYKIKFNFQVAYLHQVLSFVLSLWETNAHPKTLRWTWSQSREVVNEEEICWMITLAAPSKCSHLILPFLNVPVKGMRTLVWAHFTFINV